jgi:hypothetical protein
VDFKSPAEVGGGDRFPFLFSFWLVCGMNEMRKYTQILCSVLSIHQARQGPEADPMGWEG